MRKVVQGGASVLAVVVAFVVGRSDAQPIAPAPFKPEAPANRSLDANLYMQTAAEYRACCYQAFNLASLRLQLALAKKPAKPAAVVLDLDETVLDNGGFQAMQLRSGLAYDQRLWDIWEERNWENVSFIPGAKEFLDEAAKAKVAVVFISNRNEKFRDSTKKLLKHLEIPLLDEGHLLLSTDSSDKTKRRQAVEMKYEVLLYVGDNLRDFDDAFRCKKLDNPTMEERRQAVRERHVVVDKQRATFGDKWIILPNCAYGEWTKPLSQSRGDLELLAPTAAPKK